MIETILVIQGGMAENAAREKALASSWREVEAVSRGGAPHIHLFVTSGNSPCAKHLPESA